MEIEPTAITEAEARQLYDAAGEHADQWWQAVVQIHRAKAWTALGYASFAESVQAEFGRSAGYARRLVGHAEVVAELEAAAGVPLPDLTERQSRDVRPHLAEVAREVHDAVHGKRHEARQGVVGEIVERARPRARSEGSAPGQSAALAKVATPRARVIEPGWEPCPTCDGEGRVRADPRPAAKPAKAKPVLRKDGRCEHGFDLKTQYCRQCEGANP